LLSPRERGPIRSQPCFSKTPFDPGANIPLSPNGIQNFLLKPIAWQLDPTFERLFHAPT
jgi:hypothetical protein